jgi:hypothetical protein
LHRSLEQLRDLRVEVLVGDIDQDVGSDQKEGEREDANYQSLDCAQETADERLHETPIPALAGMLRGEGRRRHHPIG